MNWKRTPVTRGIFARTLWDHLSVLNGDNEERGHVSPPQVMPVNPVSWVFDVTKINALVNFLETFVRENLFQIYNFFKILMSVSRIRVTCIRLVTMR